MYWGWGFWGMSVFWWLFWVIAIVVFFSLLAPVPRARLRDRHETPLDVLQRRYAAGELTTAEYDERRARLLADRADDDQGRGHLPAAALGVGAAADSAHARLAALIGRVTRPQTSA